MPQKLPTNAMEIDRLATQLAKDPQSKAFLPLAEEYCKVGMWEEAVSVLEDGLKYYPAFITAMVVLGRAYDQLNQSTKARAVLEGAIKLSPDNLRAHRTLIKIYAAQGLTQQALQSCHVILAMNPKDEEALSVQASLQRPPLEPPPQPALQDASVPVSQDGEASPLACERPSNLDLPSTPSRVGQPNGNPQSDTSDRSESASPHAETIAQLESWLRSLERRRRDRPLSWATDLNR
jgi:tetratricopeptide (TPR) repeat protein